MTMEAYLMHFSSIVLQLLQEPLHAADGLDAQCDRMQIWHTAAVTASQTTLIHDRYKYLGRFPNARKETLICAVTRNIDLH